MRILAPLVVIALCASALCLYSCRKDQSSQVSRVTLNGRPVHSEQAAPFVPAEIVDIEGNHMHELHFSGGAVCGECHLSTEPMPVTRAHEVCAQCHPDQTVSKPIWLNHCLACHHFTKAAQAAAGDPQKLTEGLCVLCHSNSGSGGMIFTFHHEPSGHKIVCSRCHRPHDEVEAAAEQLCLECHPEHSETWHPTGEGLRCAICHQPHREPPKGDMLCTLCHGQATNVVMHQIPVHPKDCLACHTAHFNTFQLENGCSDCHGGQEDSDLLSQTSGHSDCSGCHRENDFTFKGYPSCGNCHSAEAAILRVEQAPEEHMNCRTCHKAHTWRATSPGICRGCHQADDVYEHLLAYHPKDCSACHDPHLTTAVPSTGDCNGCHAGDGRVPEFERNAPMPHTVCANCHNDELSPSGDFSFVGDQESCLLCHTDSGGGRAWDQLPDSHRSCAVCHPAHTWRLAAPEQSCHVCHGDIAGAAGSPEHRDCFNCHGANHGLQFAGVDGSCALCHGEPPGAHSAAGHADCLTCHGQHAFAADAGSCLICHADKAEGHYAEEGGCTDCHSFSG